MIILLYIYLIGYVISVPTFWYVGIKDSIRSEGERAKLEKTFGRGDGEGNYNPHVVGLFFFPLFWPIMIPVIIVVFLQWLWKTFVKFFVWLAR